METRDVVIELLSQFGGSREAREYLSKFSSRDSTQFAVVKVSGDVLANNLNQLTSSLGFLYHVGLFPVVLHGAGLQLDKALAEAGIQSTKIDGVRVTTEQVLSVVRPVIYQQNMALVDALEQRGIKSRSILHGVFECAYEDQQNLGFVGNIQQVNLDQIGQTIRSGALPIVTCLGETAGGQVLNIKADVAAIELVLALEPQKIIFLTPTGGLLDQQHQIISAINLETDYQRVLDSEWIHADMRLQLIQIAELLEKLPRTSSVSITSALNLTKELFTHRGAGTLVRKGERFRVENELSPKRCDELTDLINVCFARRLSGDYFEELELRQLIWADSGRAAAVVLSSDFDVPYLDKFAVTPSARGEGLGAALWEQLRQNCQSLYWRSRTENPINSWYAKQSDFSIRMGKWIVFGYGVDDWKVIGRMAEEATSRPELWQEDDPAVGEPVS